MKPSKLMYFASKTHNISLRYYFFLAACLHAIKNSNEQMRQISLRMEMIHPTIGWRWDEHRTHKQAQGSWILWSVSCAISKTMHSPSCIMSWVPYTTLCYIDSRFFSAPGTMAHSSIRLLPRSLTSLRGCSLAILFSKYSIMTLRIIIIKCVGKILQFWIRTEENKNIMNWLNLKGVTENTCLSLFSFLKKYSELNVAIKGIKFIYAQNNLMLKKAKLQ